MKTVKRERIVEYNVYITSDGKEFEDKTSAENHQKIINGKRKICERCNGKGRINGRFHTVTWNYGHSSEEMWKDDECPDCKGRGYFEKKWV